ncbi:MAG: hypothetical protein UX98_C0026G0001 [Parcubacteria group bacterium GW2011_GWA2_47_26]|nr:MAG: hypothetical protein UX98_C0026G0001 [Parcubacteria group bacterium GW2011_GWA2_47_26]
MDLARLLKKPPYPVAEKERGLVVLQPGGESYIFVFSFGALVFFNITNEKKIASNFRKYTHASIPKLIREDYNVSIGNEADAVTFDGVRIKEFSLDKLILIATVLAQSVAVEHIENVVETVLHKFERINLNLERESKLRVRGSDLIKILGTTNLILQQILSRLSLLDKPDITWNSPELEILFGHMRKMYELDDRFRAVEFKLDSIQDNSKALLSILQTRRSERLEIIIIVLIVIEVLLFIYELFR